MCTILWLFTSRFEHNFAAIYILIILDDVLSCCTGHECPVSRLSTSEHRSGNLPTAVSVAHGVPTPMSRALGRSVPLLSATEKMGMVNMALGKSRKIQYSHLHLVFEMRRNVRLSIAS